jgi:UDP-N-acetylglucosamine 2-epimerase (non-hydrolysing)
MTNLEPILSNAGTRVLLIQGDTNSMLASALTAVKLGVQVAHVEAGLRSHDWRMPEEHNRRMVDHISDLLFAPTETSKRNLIDEHVYGEVFVTGNTVIDAVDHFIPIAQRSSVIMQRVPFSDFCFVTLHRKENVDSPEILRELVDSLIELELPVVFPLHPRTNSRLREFGLYQKLASSPRVCLLNPIGYFDSLVLMKKSQLILTDSGGLQEEATAPSIRKPVIVLRSSTERPEAVEAGFARIGGVTKQTILNAVKEIKEKPLTLPERSPFGDGRAAERIVRTVLGKIG